MKFPQTLFVFLVTLLSVAALAQQKVTAAAAGGGSTSTSNVVVVNPTTQPVPVAAQGTTNVAGTVSIGNSPTVYVGGSLPAVSLADGATVNSNAIDGRNIVRLVLTVKVTGGNFFFKKVGTDTIYYVPAGKRLVITAASMSASVPVGSTPDSYLGILQDNAYFVWWFEPHPLGTFFADDRFIANGNTNFYVDENQPVFASVSTKDGGPVVVTYWVSGYLVDCGSGCTQ